MKSVLLNYLDNIMPHMEGWCSREKADALVKRVQADKPDFIVEIGVFAGRSLLAMALAAHVNGNGKVLGIDPWSIDASTQGFAPEDPNHDWWSNVVNHDYIYDRCVQFMKELGLKERVILCKGTSEHSLPGLLAAKEITGGRSLECCMWMGIIRKGARRSTWRTTCRWWCPVGMWSLMM
jgi:hypothetical protein